MSKRDRRSELTGNTERSFAAEVGKLQLGAGETFHGEAILALTKALLQAGVAYVGGYPGSPISHLMDVLADARQTVLEPLGVQLEASANEAGAAALLAASIHYPLRGAVTWKSIVGSNVASDALSNLASAGVNGGCLIIVGEDYGEGASVIQERTHAIALKSAIPLLDPRPHMPRLVDLVERAFDLSEACHLPVMLSLRIRATHMTGSFICKDNCPPPFGVRRPLPEARRDYGRIVLPPSTYVQERAKVAERLPAARRFIVEQEINEHFPGRIPSAGIIMQGGMYPVTMRALLRLGLADLYGTSELPLLVLNAVHPLVPEEISAFLEDKEEALIVEEGQPAFIEQEIRAIAQKQALGVRIQGKELLPEGGEYTADVVFAGVAQWVERALPGRKAPAPAPRRANPIPLPLLAPPRPPGFCTGCPERPLFTALKLLERERGAFHVAMDIGCNTFATLPPFNIGSTVLGYGLSLASDGAVGPALGQPGIVVMGDGGFWHNGLVTGALNAYWHGYDAVLVIIENGYASATGQQHIPSTGATPWGRPANVSIEKTLRGMGIQWVRRVDAYDVRRTMRVLAEALDDRGPHLRVVISDEECMLARQRRQRRLAAAARREGRPVTTVRFGVDDEVCNGDHACMRLSGCPALTLNPLADPLKNGPTAHVDAGCVGCGLCGSAAHADHLCPSFYRATRLENPSAFTRITAGLGERLVRLLGGS